MKFVILFSSALLALLCAGCTTWDAQTGKLFTNADNLGLDATAPNGAHLHIDSNLHSPVIHAYGRAAGTGIGAAGAAMIGWKTAGTGAAGALIGGAGNAASAFAARPPASTPTPTPAAKKP